MPSCEKCVRRMTRYVLNIKDGKEVDNLGSTCDHCCDWSFEDRKAWKGAWPVPDKYPSTPLDKALMDEVGLVWPTNREVPVGIYIKPMKQTFPWLIAGVKVATLALATRTWNKGETAAYLSTFAVSTKVIATGVIPYADNLYNSIVKQRQNQREEWAMHLKEWLTTASLVKHRIIPALWNQDAVELFRFIELPMHQVSYDGDFCAIFQCLLQLITSTYIPFP